MNMRRRKPMAMKCFFALLIIFFSFSCVKEKSCESCKVETGDTTYKNATVVFEGPLQTDGCDWLIKIDATHTYHPDALSSSFKQDQLKVKIAYDLTTDKFTCGVASLQIPVIHVIDIKQ
jgi:hypothetical protein